MKVHMHQQSGSLKQWTMITQWDGVSVREQSYHSDWWPLTCHTRCFQGLREWACERGLFDSLNSLKNAVTVPLSEPLILLPLQWRSSVGDTWLRLHSDVRCKWMCFGESSYGDLLKGFKQCDHWPLFLREKREMFPTRSNKRGKNR